NLHTNAYDGTEKLVAEYAALVQGLRDLTSVPIVLGGAAYSLQPERLLGELGADYGVVGEGERTFRDVVDALDRGTAPQRITRAPASLRDKPRPLRLRRETGLGRPSSTHGWGFAPSDLDELPPPARDLVDPRYYAFDGTDNLQTKRGCAFACAYCDYPD